MDPRKKKMLKAVPLFGTGIFIIILIVSFLIKDLPVNPVYTYTNAEIVTHSWLGVFSRSLAAASFMITFITLICIVIWIFEGIKNKEKAFRQIAFLFLSFIFCSGSLVFSHMLVIGLWTNDDESPCYYEFSDNRHTIVIEERSFLLYGGGTVYQINDDHEAVIIHTFSTDDGGRNYGHYEINWHDDYAEITYNTFNTSDSKCTDKVVFVNG